jgi:hypothetical protein
MHTAHAYTVWLQHVHAKDVCYTIDDTVQCPTSLKTLELVNVEWPKALKQQLHTLNMTGVNSTGLQLPVSLQELHLVRSTGMPILHHGLLVLDLAYSGITQQFPAHSIPTTVQHLKLPRHYNHFIGTLPPALVSLDIGVKYDYPLGIFPSTLRELVIDRVDTLTMGRYTHRLEPLPEQLRVLRGTNVRCITNSIAPFPYLNIWKCCIVASCYSHWGSCQQHLRN